MLTNEPEIQEISDGPRAAIPPREPAQGVRASLAEVLIAEGCRRETNGDVTRVIGSGAGLVLKKTELRGSRFNQGV